MTLADHLLHPDAAPLLLLAPLAWLVLRFVDRRRERRLADLTGSRLVVLAPERDGAALRMRRALVGGGILLALFALLGPLFGASDASLAPRGADIVLVLDVSRSMLARDLMPTRLRAAQREIAALAKQAGGDRLALVAFAGAARRLVPLTRDLASFAALAMEAGPESVAPGGSNVEAALDAALAALPPNDPGSPGGTSAIVLLTDGEELTGSGLAAAGRCAARGVVVHALGFGSREGSKIALASGAGEEFLKDRAGNDVVSALDAVDLAKIAQKAGGSFVDAAALPHPLLDLVRATIEPRARAAFAKGDRDDRNSQYQWPLCAALLLFALASRFSDVRSR